MPEQTGDLEHIVACHAVRARRVHVYRLCTETEYLCRHTQHLFPSPPDQLYDRAFRQSLDIECQSTTDRYQGLMDDL